MHVCQHPYLIMNMQGWWHTEPVDGKVPSAKMSDGVYGQLHERLNSFDITSLLVHVLYIGPNGVRGERGVLALSLCPLTK